MIKCVGTICESKPIYLQINIFMEAGRPRKALPSNTAVQNINQISEINIRFYLIFLHILQWIILFYMYFMYNKVSDKCVSTKRKIWDGLIPFIPFIERDEFIQMWWKPLSFQRSTVLQMSFFYEHIIKLIKIITFTERWTVL